MQDGVIVITHGRMRLFVQHIAVHHVTDALMRQIRIDGRCAKAQQQRELMHISGLAALQHDGDCGLAADTHQML